MADACPYCDAAPRKRHAASCPCSAESRRKIRAAYAVSDEEGHRVADEIRAASVSRASGGGGEPA